MTDLDLRDAIVLWLTDKEYDPSDDSPSSCAENGKYPIMHKLDSLFEQATDDYLTINA